MSLQITGNAEWDYRVADVTYTYAQSDPSGAKATSVFGLDFVRSAYSSQVTPRPTTVCIFPLRPPPLQRYILSEKHRYITIVNPIIIQLTSSNNPG